MSQKNNIYSENPISIVGIDLQVIKEIQISRHMTIYGQKLRGFKRKHNECILRHNDVFRDEIRIIVPHMFKSQKEYNFDPRQL